MSSTRGLYGHEMLATKMYRSEIRRGNAEDFVRHVFCSGDPTLRSPFVESIAPRPTQGPSRSITIGFSNVSDLGKKITESADSSSGKSEHAMLFMDYSFQLAQIKASLSIVRFPNAPSSNGASDFQPRRFEPEHFGRDLAILAPGYVYHETHVDVSAYIMARIVGEYPNHRDLTLFLRRLGELAKPGHLRVNEYSSEQIALAEANLRANRIATTVSKRYDRTVVTATVETASVDRDSFLFAGITQEETVALAISLQLGELSIPNLSVRDPLAPLELHWNLS
ncbi:hypothetical protein HZC07_03550 [Candidatus Micrarchaeota archaeon]|nr:hypothetical protein [Candidatus Micrarchaeota archaeon]